MRILELEVYLDGGSVFARTDEGNYWIDNSLYRKRTGKWYYGMPKHDNSNLIEESDEIEEKILEALKSYEDEYNTKYYLCKIIDKRDGTNFSAKFKSQKYIGRFSERIPNFAGGDSRPMKVFDFRNKEDIMNSDFIQRYRDFWKVDKDKWKHTFGGLAYKEYKEAMVKPAYMIYSLYDYDEELKKYKYCMFMGWIRNFNGNMKPLGFPKLEDEVLTNTERKELGIPDMFGR